LNALHPRRVALGVLLVTVLGGACARAAAPETPVGASGARQIRQPTVILISLDGVRHDQLDRGPFPALDRVAAEGLRAGRLVPVAPASTFPGHVSLATGTHPDVHGIVDNEFWDRARGERFDYSNDAAWIEAEPLWAAAERQGVPAATFFWVGSETDWRGVGARHRMAPFDTRIGEAEKVAQILAWLDLPAATRPHLIMSWWHGTDHTAHRLGPDHPDVAAALAAQDRHLGDLLDALDARSAWSHTTLLVVSDHGMTTAERTIPLQAALGEAGVEARIEIGSAITHVFVDDAATLARAEAALADLEGARVARRDALPPAMRLAHPTRSGDLVVRAEPGATFRSGGLLARVGELLVRRRGLHGWGPDHPDMAGIFLALGRGVPAGARPERVHTIDVAPTAARLLGIEPPQQAEGKPVAEIAADRVR
jgi:arylsulfatase A-like enzyme